MTLAELRQEVRSRLNGPGYRFLSDTRVNRFVNQARQELDNMYLWPYREKSVTGTAPLSISDLGMVEAVVNTSQSSCPLSKVDYHTLLDLYGDLSTSGTPSYYYLASPSGTPAVATYPTNTNAIGVQYWRRTADLTSDSDTPAAPADYHGLICDMATAIALRANREWNQAQALQPAIDAQVQQMLFSLSPGQQDGPDAYVGVSFASEDW